ncbi:MAG: NAD(P)H-hydrate dehydratase [Flavobacteriaceae bacterium]|nr:NAD(P)H-hydrate dehydratase [Flavobacteriaceae bacterium]
MKIFESKHIYEADRVTIQRQNISSDQLMERAAEQIFQWLHLRMQGAQVPIHIFCGIGNNGGDGLAIARMLISNGYKVNVYVVNYSDKRSKDFLLNFDRLKSMEIWPIILGDQDEMPTIDLEDIVIDAIFGIGLDRPMADWVCKLIDGINSNRAFTLSVDIPSGMHMQANPKGDSIVQANYVLSFQAPKLPFFLPSTGVYVNQWEVIDIGLDMEFLMQQDTSYHLIGKQEVLPMYMPREKFAHKGDYGHVLLIGGSHGKLGAMQLAAKGCMRSGAGLTTVYVPKCGFEPMQTAVPEVMVETDTKERYISAMEYQLEAQVVGAGIGMGTEEATAAAFGRFLENYDGALVLDADALNILSENKQWLTALPSATVLTPHPKELERLIGTWEHDFEKLEKAQAFSKKHDVILLIKGAYSTTVYQGYYYINTTGNPGMATAGSGDVLLGMITGFIAQKYSPLNACIFAVYLHGLSADLAIQHHGYQSLMATDIADGIGSAFLELFKQEAPTASQEEA